MNVRELIEQLQSFDPETEVHLAYDYGDHWHTRVAPAIRNIDEGYVKHSEYHRMDAVEDEDIADARRVVILG